MKNNFILDSVLITLLMLSTSCERVNNTNTSETPMPEQIVEDNINTSENVEESVSDDESQWVKSTFTSEEDTYPEETTKAVMPEIKTFSITAKQWDFVPSTITVNKWDTVRLEITSTDVDHWINIPDFWVSKKLVTWEKTTVEFVADKTGTFSFFCNVMCGSWHKDMKGTLIVK